MHDVTFESVLDAKGRLAGSVHRTLVATSSTFNAIAGADVFFKCENLQRGGSFKARGALNAILSLDSAAARRGVVAHSSGNHGAALAMAAKARGISAHIVVPHNSSLTKIAAVKRYGGRLSFCEPTIAARGEAVSRLLIETGGTQVHPFDNPDVIAGQGTAVLELLDECTGIESVIAPVSGGGLISGTALGAHGLNPKIQVIGAEPSAVDDAARSLATGKIEGNEQTATIADGLRATLSPRTFAIIRNHVHSVVTVAEDEIIEAMQLFWELFKLIIEPSSAVVVAALIRRRVPASAGRRIGAIISGGNVDLAAFPWI